MNMNELKKCLVCDNLVRKTSGLSKERYKAKKYCSTACAYKDLKAKHKGWCDCYREEPEMHSERLCKKCFSVHTWEQAWKRAGKGLRWKSKK